MVNPNSCNGMIHVVKEGDTLYSISKMYRIPLALILRANPYVDIYNLQAGSQICIPMRSTSNNSLSNGVNNVTNNGMMNDVNNNITNDRMTDRMNDRMNDMMNDMMDDTMNDRMGNVNTSIPVIDTDDDDRHDEDAYEYDAVMTYQVPANMSMEDVLKKNRMTVNDFLRYNHLKNVYLVEGTVVVIPKR